MTDAAAEMPRYRCHKEVWALKIAEVQDPTAPADCESDGSRIIVPVDKRYAPFLVGHDYVRKHKPEAGGYYVVYDDGYASYSPAKAFEKGYRLIVERSSRPTIEELEKILNEPDTDVRIEPDGSVTQGFADSQEAAQPTDTVPELPTRMVLSPDFGDPETLLNSQSWLQKSLEAKGARITGGGGGGGQADLDIELEGCEFNVSIRPRIRT